MKKMILALCAMGIVLVSVNSAMATTWLQAAKKGADYLCAVQNDDGGWDWIEDGDTSGGSAGNIAGATGLGLVRYYNVAGGAAYLYAAEAAGDFISATTYDNGEVRYASADAYYDWQLSLAAGDPTWSNHAKTEFFDELQNGTYGPNDYDTDGWIAAVQNARTGTWVNLRPWEFSTIAVTAKNIGNAGQEGKFKQAILDGLNTLDNTDPDNVYCDLIGVAGGVRGLAMDDVLSFTAINSPKHSGINGISTLAALADYLAGQQNDDGSWYWHSNLSSPSESDKDTQTTAYAVLALEAAADALNVSDYDDEIAAGRDWLVTMQDPTTGAFYTYPGGSIQYNEITGEATAALAPEPATMALLVLGAVAVIRRRRR